MVRLMSPTVKDVTMLWVQWQSHEHGGQYLDEVPIKILRHSSPLIEYLIDDGLNSAKRSN